MYKTTMIALLLALMAMAGQAKEKATVWENPSTEYGTSYGDGFFYLALDVTRVELKANETVVYITAQQRSDDPDSWFRFADDTYLKVGEKRFTIVSADGIELNKQVLANKDGRREMAFHFPPLPKGTRRSTSSRATDQVHSKSKASSLWRSAGCSCSRPIGATLKAIGRLPSARNVPSTTAVSGTTSNVM